MTDLNVTLFYKARFEISAATDPQKDLLWDLIMKIRLWMGNKWKRQGETIPWDVTQWTAWKKGCTFRSENGTVTFISAFHQEKNGRTNWACKIIESPFDANGYAPREWVTEIGFRQPVSQPAELSLVIFYRDRPGFLGLCAPLPDVTAPGPRLIRLLMEDPALLCTVGGERISLKPVAVTPDSYSDFRSLVLSQDRAIPVVYLSPQRTMPEEDTAAPLLDPGIVAQILGPNAMVFSSDSLDVSKSMSTDPYAEIVGCYSGGLRVYAPHPDRNAPGEQWRHRFLSGAFIREHGAEAVYGILRRALAQDISIYESAFRVEDCRALIRRAQLEYEAGKHIERIEEDMFSVALEQDDKLQKERKELEDERLSWLIREDELESDYKQAKEELFRAQQRADNFYVAAIKTSELERAMEEVRQIKEYPRSPRQVVDFFVSHYRDRLFFTENGYQSLKDCRTTPEILWEALYDMVTTLYELYSADEHLEVDRLFNQQSSRFTMSPNAGMMTRKDKRLMKGYTDTYKGRTINVEAHIKSSTGKESDNIFVRIYFFYDSETNKLVVSSCGEHKDNFTTRKVH